MKTVNKLYPYGTNFKKYVEYQVKCPACGETITYFLPEGELGGSYSISSGDTCHDLWLSIDRGFRAPYAHDMIKLREDMAGAEYLYDHYNLYPIIKGEAPEARQKRIVAIKISDLKGVMDNETDKKEWVIKELVSRNDTILNALEPILNVYEKTPKEEWPELDARLAKIDEKSSAISVLREWGYQVKRVCATVENPDDAIPMGEPVKSVM